jgi:hypothetical protein
MTPFVFIERSRLGTVFYELQGDHLRMSGARAWRKFDIHIELHALKAGSERLTTRFLRMILIQCAIGLTSIGVTVILLLQPSATVKLFAGAPAAFGAIFLARGLHWIPRVNVARFKDVVGRVAFDVVKTKLHGGEFEEFIALLEASIMKSKTPNKAPEPTTTSVTSPAAQEPRQP